MSGAVPSRPSLGMPAESLASRAAALGLLALLLLLLVPWLGAPVSRYLELRGAAAGEGALLAGLQARNAAAAPFAGPDRLVAASDAAAAFNLLQARLWVAVPPEAMRADAVELLAPDPQVPGVVRIGITAQATASGLLRFAEILEAGTPVMRVTRLDLAPAPATAAALPQVLDARIEIVAGFVAAAAGSAP